MVIQCILQFLNNFIKKKDIIIFNSFPPYSDNSLALFNYISKNRKDITTKYDIFWGQETIFLDGVKTDGVINPFIKKTPIGIWRFLQAKYIITTHGYFPGVVSGAGQVQVNLWHGCGYKSITEADHVYRGDETIITSELYCNVHAEVFDMEKSHVHVTGLPRNDLLFTCSDALNKLGIDASHRIYIWMPTYRKASKGHDEIDGSESSFGVGTINEHQFIELNKKLEQQNIILLIKLHPMDTISIDKIQGFSNIICITNQQLKDKNVALYELLPYTDGLLSDYSSVIIDYLLLDKPIVMVLSDKEEYKMSRGFVFDPIEDYFPGPIISDFSGLIEYFRNTEMIDKQWEKKRQQLKTLFHKYTDDKNCERVCNLIWGEKS